MRAGASCYSEARTLRKEMMTTQKDWPTPNTSASREIILFPAALYTPAIAAPVGAHTDKQPSSLTSLRGDGQQNIIPNKNM